MTPEEHIAAIEKMGFSFSHIKRADGTHEWWANKEGADGIMVGSTSERDMAGCVEVIYRKAKRTIQHTTNARAPHEIS